MLDADTDDDGDEPLGRGVLMPALDAPDVSGATMSEGSRMVYL